jgi:hypothetical protein
VRTPSSVDSTQSPLDAEDERRVDEELKNFDA